MATIRRISWNAVQGDGTTTLEGYAD